MRVHTIAIIASTLLIAATAAQALDRPITGAEFRVKRDANGVERLVFSSKQPVLLASPGGPDDPVVGSPGGATIELFSQGTIGAVAFPAPRDTSDPGWRQARKQFRFRHKAAPDAVSSLVYIRLHANDGVRITGKRAGLALGGHEGHVGIRITTGTIRLCALFEPATVIRDEPGLFLARGAHAWPLVDCSDASLAPPFPTATPRPTPTPGVCGDGVIDPDTEFCDGAALGSCGDFGFSCGVPGRSNECTCCSYGNEVTTFGCCDPSAIVLGTPGGGGWCFSQRCDAPFTCDGTAECLPSGDCCGKLGNPCLFTITGKALVPCCDGFECSRPDIDGLFLTCCASQESACSQDQECCSGACSDCGSCD